MDDSWLSIFIPADVLPLSPITAGTLRLAADGRALTLLTNGGKLVWFLIGKNEN